MDLKWWRSQIGLVQQEPFLFDDTIEKNIEYGLVGTQWEDEDPDRKAARVLEACREAFADEFIARLPDVSSLAPPSPPPLPRTHPQIPPFPHQQHTERKAQGLQTNVGPSGLKLSTGQRQRLSLARALIRQPPLLILDEATSSLDPRSEHVVQMALDRAASATGRTTIAIAHRLSTVRRADKIVVLAKGKVVQEGTHESLMAEGEGPYWNLATAQRVGMEEGVGPSPLRNEGVEARSMDIMESEGPEEEDVGRAGGKGFVSSFGTLLVEQGRVRWAWYMALLLGVLIAGGE